MNIAVRENQHPLDEYISILFEILNSANEESFSKLARDAERGKVARSEFPLKALAIEHRTVSQTRDLIRTVPLEEADIVDSQLYYSFLKSPDGFDEFVAYVQSNQGRRNALQEYSNQYDANVKR